MIDFHGTANKLRPEDEITTAQKLGCSISVIRAVRDVESAGSGFLSDKRPKILYEAHVFWRLTGGAHGQNNVSSPTWDLALYGAGGSHQYDRLEQALRLDQDAALKSCSWGLFQILGENYSSLGYTNPINMVNKFKTGEAEHLQAFIRFCQAQDLVEYLQAFPPDFIEFARRYNGPAYAQNGYHIKLEAAWRKHRYDADEANNSPISKTDPQTFYKTLQYGSTGPDVEHLQQRLIVLGYAISDDGDFGPQTLWAVLDLQHKYHLYQDGIVGPKTWAFIDKVLLS